MKTKQLTEPEANLRNAIIAAQDADELFSSLVDKYKLDRYIANSSWPADALDARAAYHRKANDMTEAFRLCRESGSLYPLL